MDEVTVPTSLYSQLESQTGLEADFRSTISIGLTGNKRPQGWG